MSIETLMVKVGLVTAMLAGSVAMGAGSAGAVAGFGDVADGRYFTEAVQWMVDNDITTGASPTCFASSRTATRGEAAAFIWRSEGRPAPGPAHDFTDVTTVWQQDPVSWMSNNDITTGTTPATFSPKRLVTRGEFAAFLYRLEGEPDPGTSHDFTDVTKVWQQDPVSWMSNEGITTGTSATTFSPDRSLTRGEAATFLYRYNDEPPVTVDPTSPACQPWHRGDINATPTDAVLEFVDFMGFVDPTLSEFRQGDSRSGEIEIQPPGMSGPTPLPTTAFVRLDATDNWVVIGAASGGVEVTEPIPDATVSSPLRTVFENNHLAGVVVETWPDGAGTPVSSQQFFGVSEQDVTLDIPVGVSGPATLIYRSNSLDPATTWAVATQRVMIAP